MAERPTAGDVLIAYFFGMFVGAVCVGLAWFMVAINA